MAQQALFAGGWRAHLRRTGIANLLPLAALLVFGGLFIRHISALDSALIWVALCGFALWQWVVALLFTALSFRAIGTYDVLVHRVLDTGQPPKQARAAGIKAIALSQTLGFGAFTGALVRWRCLPDLGPVRILRLSAVVSLSFLAALAVVTASVVPLSGLMPRDTTPLGTMIAAGLAALAALAVLARLAHHLGWIPAPLGATTLISLLLATAVDTGCAAAALWVLWPDAVPFAMLFAAYLVALGAGLLSNAPGGVGAFDLTMLAMLPVFDNASALAALLAFRLIYYALPAGLALIGLLRPVARSRPSAQDAPLHHPEAALLHQSARRIAHPEAPLLTLPCWGKGAILGDLPIGVTFDNLGSKAPKTLYKCGQRQASQARQRGWAVLRFSQDALITPSSWTADRPACRGLRRALRQFETSGLQIVEVDSFDALHPVAQAWAASHGGERGHSMGRFCPAYLRHQRVFAAFDGASPVAFVSFHTGPRWTLDLMRHVDDGPKGTMQALVCAGIAAARAEGAEHLSLACVPDPSPQAPFAARITRSASGLRRFKSAFGPNWQPRYICASNRITLVLTLLTLAVAIRFPRKSPTGSGATPPQQHDEDYSFAPAAPPCEARVNAHGAHDHDQRPYRPAVYS